MGEGELRVEGDASEEGYPVEDSFVGQKWLGA